LLRAQKRGNCVREEEEMKESSNGFTLEISKTDNTCPTGEKAGSRYREEGKIPVLSCEGACIRGEIARLAAHLVAKEEPYRRGCHGELFTVPKSALAQWIKNAGRIVIIDGCFLRCHGRVLENLVGRENLVQFDALSFYGKYTDRFDIDSVPEEERKETARNVADIVLAELKKMSAHDAAPRSWTGYGAAVSGAAAGPAAVKPDCGCR
jgi:uncharacterized metal-binding protein